MRMGYCVRIALWGILLASFSGQPAWGQKLEADKLTPGAEIVLDLPALGKSWRSNNASPVQMKVVLPKNFSDKVAHPVIVHMGGGQGDINGADLWNKVMEGQNFIFVAVDYTHPSYEHGIRNATEAVKVVAASTKIDQANVFLTGESSGAYEITFGLEEGKVNAFCGLVSIIGGFSVAPAKLGKKPMLLVAGENDNVRTANGNVRLDQQKAAHEMYRAAGCDSTLQIQPATGHEWKAESYPQIRDWMNSRAPLLVALNKYPPLLKKARTDDAKLKLYGVILKQYSWLEHPLIAEAKLAAEGKGAGGAPAKTPAIGTEGSTPTQAHRVESPEMIKGLVGHWKLDEGKGDAARDEFGLMHGRHTGSSWGEGKLRGAAQFDGEQHIEFPKRDFGETFTIALWCKPARNTNTAMALVSNKIGALEEPGFALFINAGGKGDGDVLFESCNGKENIKVQTPANSIRFGQWHHIAAVVDRKTGEAFVYIDGVNRADGKLCADFPVNFDWRLGMFKNGFPFVGLLDDVRYYDRLLNTAELAGLAGVKQELPKR